MKPLALIQRREVLASDAFVELVVWRLVRPVPHSLHPFKYRLAYVVGDMCVVRYDNERGKGDYRHYGRAEQPYDFVSPERLVTDSLADVMRWNRDHGRP